MQPGPPRHGRSPVFVFPNRVTFYLDDKSSHMQMLTLYNPYQSPVKFKVLCTAPDRYKVIDPEGHVDPGMMIDIVIKHNDVSPANCNAKDKFRFQVFDQATREVVGWKDVTATLCAGHPPERSTPEKDSFENIPCLGHEPRQTQYSITDKESQSGRGGSPNFAVVLSGIVCITALLLPDESEENPTIPFQISLNLKLIFAYVLGLVTMAIFKP